MNDSIAHSIDKPSIRREDVNPSIVEALSVSVPLEQDEEVSISSPLGSPHHDDRDYSDDNDNGDLYDKNQLNVNIKSNQAVNVSDNQINVNSRTVRSENQHHDNIHHNHRLVYKCIFKRVFLAHTYIKVHYLFWNIFRRSEPQPVPKIQLGRQQHCCRTCSKIFPTLYSLNMHERLHTGDKIYNSRRKLENCVKIMSHDHPRSKHKLIYSLYLKESNHLRAQYAPDDST